MGRPKKIKTEDVAKAAEAERVCEWGEAPLSPEDIRTAASEDLDAFREFERDRATDGDDSPLNSDER